MVFCSAVSAGEDLLSAAADDLLCMGSCADAGSFATVGSFADAVSFATVGSCADVVSCAAVTSCVTVASVFAAGSANTGAAVTTPCNRDATMAAARYCLGKYDLKNMIGTP